jgi:hypothetical protein
LYNYACVGCKANFTAGVINPLCCDEVVWSGGDDPNSNGCSFSTHWDTPGVKTVTATLSCGSSAELQITIPDVGKIVEDGTTDEGPLYVCLNNSVDLETKPEPSDASWPWCTLDWSIIFKPSGSNPSITPTGSYDEKATLSGLDNPGTYIIRARIISDCDSHITTGDTITVKAVEVTSVTSDKDSAAFCESVTFTVTTNPAGYADLVTWSGGGDPASQDGGSTFTTHWPCTGIGSKTVTATCCTSSKSKSVTVTLPSGCGTAGTHDSSIDWDDLEDLHLSYWPSGGIPPTSDWGCFVPDKATYNVTYGYQECKWVCEITCVTAETYIQVGDPSNTNNKK